MATQQYVILVTEQGKTSVTIVGPYNKFKVAENDAKSIDGTAGRSASVEPVQSPQQYVWSQP